MSSTTERSPRQIFDAYKQQSEVVKQEKLKLIELNNELLEARGRCEHIWADGACTECGANEQIWKFTSGQA